MEKRWLIKYVNGEEKSRECFFTLKEALDNRKSKLESLEVNDRKTTKFRIVKIR